ncbi:MAG TPA: hypothetical protein VKT22_14670 [Steroidobacteraceae bacterium]|nr:hypothetical protein [Steroidobacteraceae bacterium]
MAGLFVLTALAGFIPDSIDILRAVKAGERPALPPILHVHAILMASWLLLLMAQTSLVALGRSTQHMKLGLISIVLAPALVIAMVAVVKSTWSMIASLPPGAMTPDALSALKLEVTNTLLIQIRVIPLFAGLVAWALLVRRKDSEAHKRLMILATVMPLPAAFDRIDWLPATLPENPASVHLYTLVWLLPVLIYDLARRGRVHRVYWIGLALNVPFVIVTHLLWGSPGWLATAPRLIGVQGW